MKTKLTFIAVVAILVSACTTGTHMTRTYDDDIYFSPGDVPPVAMDQNSAPIRENPSRAGNSDAGNQRIVMSQMEKNADGTSTVNNYIYQPEETTQNSDYQAYDMDQQDLVESDTTVYYNDDSVKYVINNYYDENDRDLDFSYRINRFHRPYYYSPFFYDDWNYGGYSSYYPGYSGWGYDPWYSGGWGYPYYGYYSPFSFGYGGYWGGGYGGYGGYYGGGYGGYYGGGYGGYYGGGGYGGGYYNNYNNQQVARRRATDMNVPGSVRNNQNTNLQSGSRESRMKDGSLGNSSENKLPTNGAISNTWIQNGHERGRTINAAGNNQDTKNATIVNNRRPTAVDGGRTINNAGSQVRNANGSRSQIARPATETQGNVRRSYQPSTTGRTYDQSRVIRQGQNYTPSYNKPRIVNQSNYNNNSYTRPRTSESSNGGQAVKSSNSGTQSYSAPRSSSTMRQTYRSSSTYSSGSSNSSNRSSSPSYNSQPSSPSYSAPARSSSSGSGSSSSGSSSGGNSGGSSGGSSGGGSGHRR